MLCLSTEKAELITCLYILLLYYIMPSESDLIICIPVTLANLKNKAET